MAITPNEFAQFEAWYRTRVRPFLAVYNGQKVPDLDRDLERAEIASRMAQAEITACFLGNSGVGKSTLINALVAGHETVVPSGGIGPLTAQALRVKHATSPQFAATYHPAGQLNKLLFVVQQHVLRSSASEEASTVLVNDGTLTEDDIEDIRQLGQDSDPESDSKLDMYRKQAQLLVTGKQDGDRSSLDTVVEGLRRALQMPPKPDIFLSPEDSCRVERLAHLLTRDARSQSRCVRMSAEEPGFRESLRDHASGFLSPVIETLEVSWPSQLLESGVTLVDLPGLGIAGDVYRAVTSKWVTEEARAVVLVVDRSGISEANAQLLRTSGFLNRLLHSAYEPDADPVALIVAVVRLDDIAESRRKDDRTKSKASHFVDVCREADELVRGQVRETLERVWSFTDELPSDAKQKVISQIVSQLKVFPLSAIQYSKCLANDEDDRPFINNLSQTGVPAMIQGVREFADVEQKRRYVLFEEACALFCDRVRTTLKVIHEQWKEGTRAAADAERLREDLRSFLQPLREEFRTRQGQFREFIVNTLPGRITEVVADAKLVSGKQMRAYLRKLKDAHWKTLQAAVKRSGTYIGARQIDLPRDFALTFEEPIAESWGAKVLKDVRDRTSRFAEDCVELIEQVVSWARSQGARVSPTLIETLRDEIRADSKRLKTIGRDVVAEIRELVKNNLSRDIEGPIRRKCQTFVTQEHHVGAGVRGRILDLFDELADDALEAALPPTKQILNSCYRTVIKEIQEVFDQYQDPLKLAEDRIVDSHEAGIRRSDAQRRKAMLAEIEPLLDFPPLARDRSNDSTAGVAS